MTTLKDATESVVTATKQLADLDALALDLKREAKRLDDEIRRCEDPDDLADLQARRGRSVQQAMQLQRKRDDVQRGPYRDAVESRDRLVTQGSNLTAQISNASRALAARQAELKTASTPERPAALLDLDDEAIEARAARRAAKAAHLAGLVAQDEKTLADLKRKRAALVG